MGMGHGRDDLSNQLKKEILNNRTVKVLIITL